MVKKILIFHPALAPYRIDFFNDISENFKTRIVFENDQLIDNEFKDNSLFDLCVFQPFFLNTHSFLKKKIHYGYAQHIKEFHPDIIITSEFGTGTMKVILSKLRTKGKYKIIAMCDDSEDMIQKRSYIKKLTRKIGLIFLDGIVFCNENAQKWYKDRKNISTFVFPIIQDERKKIINNHILTKSKEYVQRYDLKEKRVYFFVGRLAPEKNLEYLINSFILQHQEHPENVLIMVGGVSKSDPRFLNRIAEDLKRNHAENYIHFVGRVEGEDLYAWYQVGQVLILPSQREAFGAVVNEALIFGDQVMVSQNAGAASLVNENNGEVIDVKQDHISFDQMNRKVDVLNDETTLKKSLMPFLYVDIFHEFCSWMKDFS